MANPLLPTKLTLEVVTPRASSCGRRWTRSSPPARRATSACFPGHTPMLTTLGLGEITTAWAPTRHLTCFWGFCEVLPDRVNILAEMGERPEDIDVGRAEAARTRAAAR